MEKRSYRDLFVISGKWLGVFLEIFQKLGGLLGNLGHCGLICGKYKGLLTKLVGIFGWGNYFPKENGMD
jgi:hypothetical protein